MEDDDFRLSKNEFRLLFRAVRNISIVPKIDDMDHKNMLIQESIDWLRELGDTVWPRIFSPEQCAFVQRATDEAAQSVLD